MPSLVNYDYANERVPPELRMTTAQDEEQLAQLPLQHRRPLSAPRTDSQDDGDQVRLRGRPALQRAKSDFVPRDNSTNSHSRSRASGLTINGGGPVREQEWVIRHGFDTQLASEEQMYSLNSNYFMYYTDKKHETGGQPSTDSGAEPVQEWRMRDRLKTVSAVLAMCLNLGVDPPDVVKTNPCAKLECWVDPAKTSTGQSGNSPINQIGKALQTQYEQLSMRTRYKLCLDPTVDETRRYSQSLRRNARNERVLFHYNGHGVPRPTHSGEIWVFNRSYTQYIPISLYDLQSWVGAPSLFVWDCADAGSIIKNFLACAKKHEQEQGDGRDQQRADQHVEAYDFADCIHLASCMEKENLPTNPALPADIFTSCLTTPIEMAVRFFILQNPLPSAITIEDANNIPGRVSERRTPSGELNWIFTAITDTIAWNSLPKPLFKRLFRQDLMVAALFRNFLLAQRIMRVYHCHPQCHPEIPDTHNHPLWRSWDLAVEMILAQLPELIAAERGDKHYEYQHSNFFAEQLTAFEVYLSQGALERKIPEQLPIVLQVLLSQVHRLRALILLSKFLDLGPWAVNLALSIGIFPYVLKLLQSQALELKPVMIFIWARILAVDQSCQSDLLKDNGYQYFIAVLDPRVNIPITNQGEHRAMSAFIIAMFCKDFKQGQNVCMIPDLVDSCVQHLSDMTNPLLRHWSCLCLSMLWISYADAKWLGIRRNAHSKLCELALDPVAEVRAAMLHALTSFLGIPDLTPQVVQIDESIASNVLIMASDGNSMVRNELLIFLSTFVLRYQRKFVVAAYEHLVQEERETSISQETSEEQANPSLQPLANDLRESRAVSHNTVYAAIWKQVLSLTADPHPEVADSATIIVLNVLHAALQTAELAPFVQSLMDGIERHSKPLRAQKQQSSAKEAQRLLQSSQPLNPSTPSRTDSYLSLGLKRTASVAQSLKNFAFGSTNGTLENNMPSTAKSPTRNGVHNSLALPSRGRIPTEWQRPPEGTEANTTSSSWGYHAYKVPSPRKYRAGDRVDLPLLPLVSRFFEWSTEYFREPQMKATEADNPGSTDYNQRLWRRNRNDKVIAKTQPLKGMAGSNPWNKSKAFLTNGSQPLKMCFHQFEDHLIVGDDKDTVNVWDWKRQLRLARFSNGNPGGSRITELRLINEDDQALLMTGSSDGIIRIFRNYDSDREVELVDSFRALTDLVPSTYNAGLVFDWQQSCGNILVAGDVKVIKVWNAGSEICGADINARSGSCITSLTSDQVEGFIFVAGYGDGAVRIFDIRNRPQEAMVRVWKEHKAWITNVHLQRGGQRELVSACRSGDVKMWDMRWDKSVRTIKTTKDTLRTMAVHEHAPVFATGTSRHSVKLFNTTTGNYLNSFEPYSGFLQQGRGSAISSTCFHPHRMIVAASAMGDHHINIFGCKEAAAQASDIVFDKSSQLVGVLDGLAGSLSGGSSFLRYGLAGFHGP